jgi:UDP-3-O-[3-hydroxymyristoyl] glucosamine N-acyltransferase
MDFIASLPRIEATSIRLALNLAAETLKDDFVFAAALPAGFLLKGPSEAKDPKNASIIFAGAAAIKAGFTALCRERRLADCLIILSAEALADKAAEELADSNIVVRAKNPKYAYALIAGAIYPLASWRGTLERKVGANAWAAEDASIAEGTVIEPEVTIGRGARIGKGCILMHGCSIGPRVSIGDGSVIREKAVIGDLGFGFAFDGDRPPLRLPQLGGVRIGVDVEVGAFSTIGAGTMRPTLVENFVKISDHVHIAHNCTIGEKSIITCGVMISGSTRIGSGCWLAPGAIVRNGIELGSDVTVGLGAVVVNDVAPGLTVMGLPAKPIDRLSGRPVSAP